MPEFSSVTFSGDQEGLFSAEEVKRLMRAECARASRYGYPVTAMRMAVDRLDQLGDLYGFESREAILKEVTAVVRRNTRESDFLGYKVGGNFHAIFPHTSKEAGPALASRLLKDTAQLVFDEGSARVQVTLSIGVTYCAAGQKVDFDTLTNEASAAIDRALHAGGSRFEVYVAPEPVLEQLPAKEVDPGAITEHLSGMLDTKLEDLFKSMGKNIPDFGGREHEVLALAVKKMEANHDLMREQHARQVELLERRLTKVSDSLEETESVLRRSAAAGAPDTGVASIYRSVQGLADVEDDLVLKKEMMSKIFEANLELHNQLPPNS
jgi:diguanylate cyclase (GGDEF)-like protein